MNPSQLMQCLDLSLSGEDGAGTLLDAQLTELGHFRHWCSLGSKTHV